MPGPPKPPGPGGPIGSLGLPPPKPPGPNGGGPPNPPSSAGGVLLDGRAVLSGGFKLAVVCANMTVAPANALSRKPSVQQRRNNLAYQGIPGVEIERRCPERAVHIGPRRGSALSPARPSGRVCGPSLRRLRGLQTRFINHDDTPGWIALRRVGSSSEKVCMRQSCPRERVVTEQENRRARKCLAEKCNGRKMWSGRMLARMFPSPT